MFSAWAKAIRPFTDLIEPYRRREDRWSVLGIDPVICFSVHPAEDRSFWPYPLRHLNAAFKELRHRPAWFFFMFEWDMQRPKPLEAVHETERSHLRRYPRHRFVYLAATPAEYEMMRQLELRAVFCSHNALVDESIFRPMPGVNKDLDAVYNAKLCSFKRHGLATETRGLGLITYFHPDSEPDYIRSTVEALRSAHWFNGIPLESYRKLSSEEVVHSLNRCRVGLCLSAKEGAMYASIEYLLCGLPLVSTRSVGGRDVFFDEEYVMLVEDNPGAVRQGVEEMIARQLPPDYVREKTLKKIAEHRGRLRAVLQEIYDESGSGKNASREWNDFFFNKLWKNEPEASLDLERLRKDRSAIKGLSVSR